MKGNGKTTNVMVKEPSIGLMVNTMLAITIMTNATGRALTIGPTERNTLVNGKRINAVEVAGLSGATEISLQKVNGTMISW